MERAPARSELLAESGFVQEDERALRVTGQLQTRYILNRRDGQGDDIASGFVLRRARIGVRGEDEATGVSYVIVGSFDRDGGAFELLNAYLDRAWETGESSEFGVRVGRFRPPSLLELEVPSQRRQAMERTLVAEALKPDRAPGIGISQRVGRFGVAGSVTDGGQFGGDELLQYSGRAELVLAGDRQRFRQFSTIGEAGDFAWLLGAGALYIDRDDDGSNADDAETFTWTLDTLIKHGRYSLYGALLASGYDPAVGPSTDRIGAVGQASARIGERHDVFVRYEWADADDIVSAGSRDELSVLTVGGNYYMIEHALKLTADVGYAFNGVADFWAAGGSGYLTDAPGERGQVVLRMQVQVVF